MTETHEHEEEQDTFAVGHLALGYLTGKATSKLLDVDMNIPLLFVASVVSDIDLLIPGLRHRGPTHSLFIILLIFLPAFFLYGRRATPYFAATAQHSIIGDYLTSEGVQLLWPIAFDWYGLGFAMTSLTNILVEWIFFLASLTIMLKAKDAWTLFQRHPSNLILSIPVFTVLIPTLLSFPVYVSLELIIPHLIYLAMFTVSILIDLVSNLRTTQKSLFK